jgi:hypothetical protein
LISVANNYGLYQLAKVNLGSWHLLVLLLFFSIVHLKSISFLAIDNSCREMSMIMPSTGHSLI